MQNYRDIDTCKVHNEDYINGEASDLFTTTAQ